MTTSVSTATRRRLRSALRLVLVTDRSQRRAGDEDLVAAVEGAVRGGVTAVQLREKDLRGRDLLALAEPLRRVTARRDAWLLVNERLDVALAAGADGVHLGFDAMDVDVVRSVAPRGLPVGISVHSAAEGRRRVARERPDYVVLGPIFATPSKRRGPARVAPIGPEAIRQLARQVDVPVVAVGGIDAERVGPVMRAGADGVAVIGAILGRRDAERAARDLFAALDAARKGRAD